MAEPAIAHSKADKRRSLLGIFFALLVLAGAGATAYYWYHLRFFESTDDAYVAANIIPVTPQITGTVREVSVRDTDHVAVGQAVVELDDADARIALESAEAQLARTVRDIRTVFATNDTLAADVIVRRADLTQAQTLQKKAEDDFATRKALVVSGAVGKEELKHAEAALAAANAAVSAAQSGINAAEERLAANRAMTEGTSIEAHPSVAQAASRVREAHVNWARCKIAAPVSGDIVRRTVQVGQRVQPGTPLLSIVPLEHVWVEANFKEVQLGDMRIGQPVKVLADVYGSETAYDGKVVGFAAGTGAAFALLPAQNATGNWIKIVQRVPVRIELNPEQVAARPLRVGLSLIVHVDTHDDAGQPLGSASAEPHLSHTSVFDGQRDAAEQRIAEIIAANRGKVSAIPARP